jgi:hypothetical protein
MRQLPKAGGQRDNRDRNGPHRRAGSDRGDSGGTVLRKFCGRCGSPVITDIPGLEAQGIRVIKAGTLDDRSGLDPATHYWTESAQDWMVLPEKGVKVPRQ